MSHAAGPIDRRISGPGLARVLGRLPTAGPGYTALAEAIRRAVLDGALPLGTRLPSERELAQTLGLSRTTTGAAYQRLRDLGLLTTRRGSGSVTTVPEGLTAGGVGLVMTASSEDGPVDLTIAAPSAPPQLHGAVERALEALPAHTTGHGYTHQGLLALRARIAERYTARGTPTTADQILVTNGAQQAISLLLAVTVGPGDRVVIEQPSYPNAVGAVRGSGARPVPVPVGPSGLDLDLLDSTVRQVAPRLVYLTPDHHNPTGTSLDDAGRQHVREIAGRHRTLVVADETLTDLTIEGPRPASISGPSAGANLVAVGSASKTFWGGLRVGWVRGPRELVTRLATERSRHDISTALLDQLVTCALIDVEEEVLAARRPQLRTQRDTLLAAVRGSLPWQVRSPQGGLSVWADLGAPVSSALAAVALQHGVRIVPGPTFGVDGSLESRLRLTFSQEPEVIERGVARLADAWTTLGLAGDAGHERALARTGAAVI
ncbi:PLP-dependent aminotransferase family protein [Actinotalea sp. BY-33]|uniref:PLP-dependent aminotransferase family protein n=1 Tax=Actinotalea soli TaxID=2819234 RepID=A0A939RUG2_9CELL|nr:PLP-dependent aminotransferase family protein [Actinotalea soli]MBO1750608.1 PLP-dependent aminotransferase family protein [Actinotalea soli]